MFLKLTDMSNEDGGKDAGEGTVVCQCSYIAVALSPLLVFIYCGVCFLPNGM